MKNWKHLTLEQRKVMIVGKVLDHITGKNVAVYRIAR